MREGWREWLLTLLFPHKCFLCGRVLPDTGWLCAGCVLPETEDLCPRCGKEWNACICGRAAYDGACAPLWYADGVRVGIHRFKYDGRAYYAAFLGELMTDCIRANLQRIPFDLVTYVPMHVRKRRARGYCQSELLAREVAQRLDLPLEETLRHTKNRRAQMEQKGIANRRENARKSFEPLGKDLSGLRVLLVDDVLTSGSTASRCAELLKEQGAEYVFLAAAATTRRERGRQDSFIEKKEK